MSKYQTYPEYKDSGVEWLAEIPKHWDCKKLKFFLNELVRGPFGSALKKELFTTSGIKVYEQKNCIQNNINLGDSYISKETYSSLERFSVRSNDLLMSCSGTIGKIVEVTDPHQKGIINQALLIMRIDTNIINKSFFKHIFRSEDIQKQIKDNTQGGAMQNLVATDIFKSISFAIPSNIEQQKIAAFLDHETAKIDTLIEKQQQLIELLKEKRQAVISHAVTKGLNPDAPMKDSGVEWLGEVPEHWSVLRLKHLIQSLESGCSVNAADIPAKDNEIGVLKTSCVYTRQFRVEENKTVILDDLSKVKCPIRKGSIIISRMNTPELVGASALVDVEAENIYLPDRLWQTIFNDDYAINSEYLAHFMTVAGFRNQISLAAEGASSSMQNIAKEDYLAINTLLPPLNEQLNIIEYLRSTTDKFDELVHKANTAINLMQERRTALISAAVTGKIDVRHFTLKDGVAPTTSSGTNEAQQEVTA